VRRKTMKIPLRMAKHVGRSLLVVLMVGSMLNCAGLLGSAFGEEGEKKESYIRPVDSSPSLAETEKGSGWSYNSDYLFALSRAVRDSRVHPAGKVFLFIPAVPLDIALSPFAAIAGLFGD
jgi:hypothetical protein